MTIHWKQIEKEAGATLEEKYEELMSTYRVGEFFGSYHGVWKISNHAVAAELSRRGIPIGQHETMKNSFPWKRIVEKMGYRTEKLMLEYLYWVCHMTELEIAELIEDVTGYKMTDMTISRHIRLSGIKTRGKGGRHEI